MRVGEVFVLKYCSVEARVRWVRVGWGAGRYHQYCYGHCHLYYMSCSRDKHRHIRHCAHGLLQIAYGISNLIFYLANNEFGSIVINDFRRQQFIIVDGDVKLTDVDDVSFEEPTCMSDQDCLKQLQDFQSDAPNETR